MAYLCIVVLISPLLVAVMYGSLVSANGMNLFTQLCGGISINDTEFGSQNSSPELVCEEQPHQQEINASVQEFKRTSNWTTLHLSLVSLLNDNSVAYRQLKTIGDGEPLVSSKIGACGYAQLISLLLCAGLDMNSQAYLTGDHWLFGASETGLVNLVKLLLSRGADANMSNNEGNTPLMLTIRGGHIDVVKALVEAGANTTLRNVNGVNPLDEARLRNRTEIVEYLENLPH